MAIIDDPSAYFQTTLYTGNGGTNAITNTGNSDLQPDWIWFKRRDGADNHIVFDVVRGVTKAIYPDLNNAEDNLADSLASFNSDGFTLGADTGSGGSINGSSETNVAWCWKAGTSFTNDASSTGIGSMDSAGSVNEEAGFAIVSYTGNETASTLKHGLSTVPQMIIVKGRIAARDWVVGQHTQGWTKSAYLNEANAFSNQTHWNNTAPTSSVFTIEGGSNSNVNTNNAAYIAYVFSERQGYSKFGSYTGNGNADGTFIYTGFKPAWVLVKRTNASGNNWQLHDIKRTQYAQPINHRIAPNVNLAEQTGDTLGFDFVSNGFRPNNSNPDYNGSGSEYIYMAFAENPFVASNFVTTTAR